MSARPTASAQPGRRRGSRGQQEPPGPEPEIAPLTPDGPGLPLRGRRAPLCLTAARVAGLGPARCGTATVRPSVVGHGPDSRVRSAQHVGPRVRYPTRPSTVGAKQQHACRIPDGARRPVRGITAWRRFQTPRSSSGLPVCPRAPKCRPRIDIERTARYDGPWRGDLLLTSGGGVDVNPPF